MGYTCCYKLATGLLFNYLGKILFHYTLSKYIYLNFAANKAPDNE